MMILNRHRLLALLLGAAAVLSLVGSATASAAVWKDGGKEVTTAFSLGLSGAANYEIEEGAGGIQCTEHLTLSSTGGSNASISALEDTGCKGFGTLAACTVSGTEVFGLSWGVTLGAETETIASMHVKHKFKTGCKVTEINKTLNVTLTPLKNEAGGIEGFETFATEGAYRQFGSYEVEGTNKGTYEIG